ncbi:hypothetical protein DM01DRAFT_1386475 [Hesseltinella vesiculosa]|uniref:PHD-type domain-containing protein n=1 Tax=Hesseltinella vesiculosa TaxID=101127 RepID=A0A1X2G6R1_9FUNG|nr:hypothetical protein DM01DRAFT_1386475 [Hesseltinella vesiculosa]
MAPNAVKPVFGSLENQTQRQKRSRIELLGIADERPFKHIRPAGPHLPASASMVEQEEVQKENVPPVLVQFAPVETATSSPTHSHHSPSPSTSPSRFVPHTYTTQISGDTTRTNGRATIGCKSIGKPKPSHEHRLSPEQLKLLSRRIDPSLPMSPRGSPSKPVLPDIFQEDIPKEVVKPTVASHCMYQTCVDLWPTEPTLGDLGSDNIKNLTNMLKVRLSQAKYRLLSKLEDEEQKLVADAAKPPKISPAFARARRLLNDDIDYSTWPTFEKHVITLTDKRTRSFLTVVGNAKGLHQQREAYLERHHQKRQLENEQAKQRLKISIQQRLKPNVSCPPPARHPLPYNKKDPASAKRKRPVHPSLPAKPSKKNTKDVDIAEGRQQAALVNPTTMEDGTQAFVCAPCSKQYKTRNGLAYHLARCANRIGASASQPASEIPTKKKSRPVPTQPQQQTTEDLPAKPTSPEMTSPIPSTASSHSTVQCICDHPTDDDGMMLQCDQCQLWLHLDCVGGSESVLEDVYHCPRCIQTTTTPASPQPIMETPLINHSAALDSSVLMATPLESLSSLAVMTPSSFPQAATPTQHHPLAIWDHLLSSAPDVPSLLYSDATAMTSTLDEDLHYAVDMPSDLDHHDLPPTDWFQFANFDDDFHCDDDHDKKLSPANDDAPENLPVQ